MVLSNQRDRQFKDALSKTLGQSLGRLMNRPLGKALLSCADPGKIYKMIKEFLEEQKKFVAESMNS